MMQSISALVVRWYQPAIDHRLTSWLFLKLLALIYFSAFLSLAVQIIGLVGANGILPLEAHLDRAYQDLGRNAWWQIPTLFWFGVSDPALLAVTIAGCGLSALLFFGLWKRLMLIVLFVLYLSLTHAGQIFLRFQWDTLLLETGFLAIFLVNGPSGLLVFLYHWLLFRLRFMSGVAKLASGDPSWSGLTTLNYYFETQPLPQVGAWFAHHLPEWLLKAGVAFTLFSELIVPFFIFLPRPFRLFAAGITIIMQLLIIATSNHDFVNLLTILLCLFLLDDRVVAKVLPARFRPTTVSYEKKPNKIAMSLLSVVGVLVVISSVSSYYYLMSPTRHPVPLERAAMLVQQYGVGNIYHIFAIMQTERHELEIQGSYNGYDWSSYRFRYKPGPLDRKPPFIVPHQPRLDWMIWFVPPQNKRNLYWFERFMVQLHRGSPQVLGLLKHNPFQKRPPRFLRALVYRYDFTTAEEKKQTGHWWKREYLGVFPNVPPRRP